MPEWYWVVSLTAGTLGVIGGVCGFLHLAFALNASDRTLARAGLALFPTIAAVALLWPLAVLAGLGLLVRAAELPMPRLPKRRPRGDDLAERIRELEVENGMRAAPPPQHRDSVPTYTVIGGRRMRYSHESGEWEPDPPPKPPGGSAGVSRMP